MKIEFEKERGEFFAVAKNAIWNGKVHEELLFAEIVPIGVHTFKLLWEDSYSNPEFFNDLESAKKSVINNYSKHIPFNNGSVYEIEEL
jgi:hypothetical protein